MNLPSVVYGIGLNNRTRRGLAADCRDSLSPSHTRVHGRGHPSRSPIPKLFRRYTAWRLLRAATLCSPARRGFVKFNLAQGTNGFLAVEITSKGLSDLSGQSDGRSAARSIAGVIQAWMGPAASIALPGQIGQPFGSYFDRQEAVCSLRQIKFDKNHAVAASTGSLSQSLMRYISRNQFWNRVIERDGPVRVPVWDGERESRQSQPALGECRCSTRSR